MARRHLYLRLGLGYEGSGKKTRVTYNSNLNKIELWVRGLGVVKGMYVETSVDDEFVACVANYLLQNPSRDTLTVPRRGKLNLLHFESLLILLQLDL